MNTFSGMLPNCFCFWFWKKYFVWGGGICVYFLPWACNQWGKSCQSLKSVCVEGGGEGFLPMTVWVWKTFPFFCIGHLLALLPLPLSLPLSPTSPLSLPFSPTFPQNIHHMSQQLIDVQLRSKASSVKDSRYKAVAGLPSKLIVLLSLFRVKWFLPTCTQIFFHVVLLFKVLKTGMGYSIHFHHCSCLRLQASPANLGLSFWCFRNWTQLKQWQNEN